MSIRRVAISRPTCRRSQCRWWIKRNRAHNADRQKDETRSHRHAVLVVTTTFSGAIKITQAAGQSNDLLHNQQLACRPNFSTKTAILQVLSNDSIGHWRRRHRSSDPTLSAAFDTVDYGILLHHLRISFDFTDLTLGWFWSNFLVEWRLYLSGSQ